MDKGRESGTWNVRSLYRAASLTTAPRELAIYKINLVGVQGVRWDKVDMARAGGFYFFYGKRNENHQLEIFLHHRILSAVRRAEFVSNSDSSVRSLV
jgi:hypothetical protein